MKQIISKIKVWEGFSLIEISVALFIIGVFLTVVLKTNPLMESVHLRSLVKMVESYRIATTLFMERYGSLPGDCPHASDSIHTSLKNGNGNGRIEGEGLDPDSEAFWFWQHLGISGFISHPGRSGLVTEVFFGKGVPRTKMGGYFTIAQDPMGRTTMNGPWILLGKIHGLKGTGALLTPLQAKNLMEIFGEGDPHHGSLRIEEATDVPSGSCFAGEQLRLQMAEPACIAYFKLLDV